jgi:hypothetical protein
MTHYPYKPGRLAMKQVIPASCTFSTAVMRLPEVEQLQPSQAHAHHLCPPRKVLAAAHLLAATALGIAHSYGDNTAALAAVAYLSNNCLTASSSAA